MDVAKKGARDAKLGHSKASKGSKKSLSIEVNKQPEPESVGFPMDANTMMALGG